MLYSKDRFEDGGYRLAVKKEQAQRASVGISLVPLVCFFLYFAWSCVLPIDQAPDEATRLGIPFYIAQNGALPSGFEESLRNQIWGISYAFTPYGSSLLSAVFVKAAMILGAGDVTQVVAARLSSCIFGSLTVFVLMLICVELEFDRLTATVAGAVLGFLPQFAFLSSYLNNDIFSAFCAAMVVLGWIRGFRRGWDVGPCAFLGAAIGLLSLSYYFAYGLIPISIFVFFASARRLGVSWGGCFRRAGVVFVVAFAIGGWFFVRNALIYSGDFLGMRSYSECAELYAQQEYRPSVHQTLKMSGEFIMSPLFDSTWLWMTFRSCVAYFGYMAYPIAEFLYLPFIVFCCVGLALPVIAKGRLVPISGHGRLGNGCFADKLLVVALIAAAVSPVVFSAYRSWATDWEPQGRYIVSAWIAVAVLWAWGFDCLVRRIGTSVLRRALAVAPVVLVALMLCVCSAAVFYPYGFAGIVRT